MRCVTGCAAALLLLVGASSGPVWAAIAEDKTGTAQQPSEAEALDEVNWPFAQEDDTEEADTAQEPGEPVTEESPWDDPCDWELENQELQEQTREVLRSWSCHSFRWFDSLWGSEYDYPEEAVNGLLNFGAEYTRYDGLDPRFRLRVRAPLPNLSTRWDLILGRVNEEAFVTDTQAQDKTFYNPGAIERAEDDAWLLGLGHRGKQRRSGWDYSAGVRLRLPPEPYVKAQYYYNHDFNERSDFRFRQTFFWRSDRGFGTTSRGDLAYGIDANNVLRWEAFGTIHEETQGTQWYAGQTWYHLFGDRSAFSLRAFVNGETSNEVPLQEYGFDLVWRKPFTREWMFLSLGPSITWPRYFEDEERKISLGFGAWIEIVFGNWRW
jgi:hypothetical protein